ncbi:MAG: hypothetical protein GY791_13560 [Alphaproteobacteria bacterium]|nr:hypothetical protein [Alphaproteobacteria bacterium]
MPSFVRALDDDSRWYLANFIKSLQVTPTQHQALQAKAVDGALPTAPDDPAWESAEPMDLRLAGQVVAAPRWQNPSIELVTVQALFNDEEIAFRLAWDDPFRDVTHDPDAAFDPIEIGRVGALNSYVEAVDMVPRALETYRDSVALQFPVKLPEGTKKPHFYRGDSSNPVHLWVWKADLDAEGDRAVEEGNARGWKQPIKIQAEDKQHVASSAQWDQGRWTIVTSRPLRTDDKNDVQFEKGVFIPMAANAWDGSNGEHGLIMSLSTWFYVFLEASTPITVYLYAVLAFVVVGALGIWLMRKVEHEQKEEEEAT